MTDPAMDHIPILARGALRLVPFGERHLTPAYVGWLNDPDTMRYSEQRHRQHSLDSCRAFVAGFSGGPNQLWAIEAMDQDAGQEGRHIGNITASHDVHNRIADIGILIGADGCQGKGYGLTAWSLVLEHLAARPDLHKVTGGCLAANTAMVRIMQRAGMKPDGVRPAHYLLDGQPVDIVYYAMPGGFSGAAPEV